MYAHLFWGNLCFQENAEYASLLGPNVVLLFLYSSFVLCCSSTNVLVFITFLCFIKAEMSFQFRVMFFLLTKKKLS
jgi:hypothetical protein